MEKGIILSAPRRGRSGCYVTAVPLARTYGVFPPEKDDKTTRHRCLALVGKHN